MLKKLFCVFITFIILITIFILPVSAEEATEATTVQSWTAQNWKEYFYSDLDPTTDIKNYEELANDYFKTNGYTVNNSIIMAPGYDDEPTSLRLYVTDGNFKLTETIINNQAHIKMSVQNSTYIQCLAIYRGGIIDILSNDYSATSRYVVYNATSLNVQNYFYCANPYQSFLDYLKMGKADFNKIVPPEGFNESAIKDSYCFDNPYNNYGFKPYENDFENYLTAGLFSDLKIYYDSYFNVDSEHEHSETLNFYVDITDSEGNLVEDYHEHFSSHMQDYITDGEIPEKELSSFINAHFRAVHFERDSYSVLDFFNPGYRDLKYTSFNEFISVEMIDKKYYLKFTLGSDYTFTGNIFLGHRITHTCSHINIDTGVIGGSGNGLGSDLSEADDTLSRPPTKEELKDIGFDYGYPNTAGSYPYKLTIYRNGKEYVLVYFSKMPSVTSNWYSNKCIDYGVNVMNTKVYMYFKEQNMSKQFDFTNNNDDIYNSDMVQAGSIYDNFVFKPIDEATGHLLNSLLNVNVSEFNNTYTLHFWTNYSGSFENMCGFYCKFNWDLEESGHFQKNNSDDDYDYTQDYHPDESFTDNNGNIHGGAVEIPTEEPIYTGFNNGDFSFDDNNVWAYANSFLNFNAKAFKVLPSFVWQLISCGIVIAIICRIAAR